MSRLPRRSRPGGSRRGGGFPRFARTDQASLLAAIVAVLIAGVTAAILHPTGPAGRSFPREAGALLAPPSESAFTDEWGRPGAPAAERAGSSPVPGPPGGTPSPQPAPPAPLPPPGAPDDPPGEGLLPDLPILPPLPPPLSILLPDGIRRAMSLMR